MKLSGLVGCALGALLFGCGGGALRTRDGTAPAALLVRPVAWNATRAPVGKVRAVADAGDVAAVFSDDGARVFTAGALVATDTSVKDWVDADTIAGPDGSGRWIIGVSAKGTVYHLRGRSSFEEISDRYGLGKDRVHGAAVLGPDYVAFLLDREVVLADGQRVARFGLPSLQDIVGGGGFGAGVAKDGVFVFTAAHHAARRYALPEAKHVALGPDGRLYAATTRALYASTPAGALELLYETPDDSIHGLVVSADHVWFSHGSELGVIDGTRIAETRGAKIATDATIAPSTTGDVWVLAHGALSRFARIDPEPTLARAWNGSLSGVFARACASCHLPDGPSGVDLSTPEAWHSHRAAIRDRVTVTRSMPPSGRPLADEDRAAIEAWARAADTPEPGSHP